MTVLRLPYTAAVPADETNEVLHALQPETVVLAGQTSAMSTGGTDRTSHRDSVNCRTHSVAAADGVFTQ